MTRINTNVSSLNAQKTLARSNAALQDSLTRLSTGLRINKGKDDPAGLIASEVLRADITSIERAITNNTRANQMIATADSALGQVSGLLNDIRGLISEAANSGAMSDDQIAANQMQIDSSLEAIDRISQVTAFQGRRLLDGNLDFITEDVSTSQITDLDIEQANFGALEQIDVSVNVATQATQASLNYGFGAVASDVVLEVGGKNGFEAFSFASGSTIEDMAAAINLVSDSLGLTAEVETAASTGAITASSFGANNDINIVADTAGEEGGDIRIKYTEGTAGIAAGYEDNGTAGDVLAAGWTAASGTDPAKLDVTLATQDWVRASVVANADAVANNAFAVEARIGGAEFNGVSLKFSNTDTVAAGSETATYDHTTGDLVVQIHAADTTGAMVVAAINKVTIPGVSSLFYAELMPDNDGSGKLAAAAWITAAPTLDLAGGVDGGAVTSTANDVIAVLNATGTDVADAITASLATGDDGYGTLSAFSEFADYGTAEANNRLQFLAPDGSRDIRFVAGTSAQSLSVDTSTDPEITAYSKAVVSLDVENTIFEIEARNKGSEYDDVEIVFVDSTATANNYATWDPQAKKLTLAVDLDTDKAQVIVDLINTTDSEVSKFWRARAFGTSDLDTVVTDAAGTVATTSGGVASEGTVVVNLETDADGLVTTTAQDLIDYFDDTTNSATLSSLGISVSNAEGSDGSGLIGATTADLTFATSGTDMQDHQAEGISYAINGEDARIKITAVNPGAEYDNVTVEFEDTAAAAGSETFSYDAVLKKLTIGIVSGTTDAKDIWTDAATGSWAKLGISTDPSYDPDLFALFTMVADGAGTAAITTADTLTLTGGVTDDGSTDGAALLGNEDSATIGLNFKASEYGSDAFVSVKALNGTSFAVTDSTGATTERVVGTDIDARINGVQAIGDGLNVSLNTSSLDMSFSVASSVTSGTTMDFSITGGGAKFQLGPDVVSNQQARLGITSVNTAKLGGTAGRLFELRSGKGKSLANDVSGAASVAEQVISQIVNLRGRLGAFQRTTLDTNINALGDTLEALTAAESDIRDADFALESANLTRAQVLVQSGLSVLSIANSNPQSVLSLLR